MSLASCVTRLTISDVRRSSNGEALLDERARKYEWRLTELDLFVDINRREVKINNQSCFFISFLHYSSRDQ